MRTNQPILQELLLRLPATIELSLVAMLFAILVGIPIGILAGVWPNSPFDHVTRVLSLIGVSSPAFWLALFLQVIFAIYLGLLPVSGRLDVMLRPERLTGFMMLDGLLQNRPDVALDAFDTSSCQQACSPRFMGGPSRASCGWAFGRRSAATMCERPAPRGSPPRAW